MSGTIPCADCAKPIYKGNGTLPVGLARCKACRRANPARPKPTRREDCQECGSPIPAERNANSIYCSQLCKFRVVNRKRADVPRRQKLSPEAERAKGARRYAVAPSHTINRSDIYERDGWTCQLCGDPVDRSLRWPDRYSPSLDHIVPVALGGPHTAENLQLAHLRCNSRKGAKAAA